MMPAFRRKTFPASAQMQSQPKTFLAPIKGWIQSESLAIDMEGGASILENFFPTTRGIRPRGGLLRRDDRGRRKKPDGLAQRLGGAGFRGRRHSDL